jgi:hypothetical protein
MRKVIHWKRSKISVESGSHTPQMYSVRPNWFEYGFTDEKSVACYEVWLTFEQPAHLGESDTKLFPFCKDILVPGKSSVKMQPEILDIFCLRKLYIIYVDRGARGMSRLRTVGFHSPFLSQC